MDAAPCRAVVDIETAREKQKQLAAGRLAPGVIYDEADDSCKQQERGAPADGMRFNAMLVSETIRGQCWCLLSRTKGGGVLWFCSAVLSTDWWGELGPTPTLSTQVPAQHLGKSGLDATLTRMRRA